MSFSGTISLCIERVKAGYDSAATLLWERYAQGLKTLAKRKLLRTTTTVTDEDDIAVDAFHSFVRRCRAGDYPDVRGRNDLWRLLAAITIHKANNQVRNQQRQKREGGQGVLAHDEGQLTDAFDLDQLFSPDPPPELTAMVSDTLDRLFSIIPDGELRQMVLYKIEGYTNAEIAAKVGRSLPTIERRLRLIRDKWRKEFDD